ncbi:MAG: M23 family metallopeptidase [Burkholderiaceae bacterium]
MQILITDSSLIRTRALHFKRWQLALVALSLATLLLLISGAIYHFVFLTAAREGWPVVSQLVKLVVRDELAQRERFMRENLDAMAGRVGEMQAKLVKLEALSERVTGMAGVKSDELKALPVRTAAKGGQGGPLVPLDRPTLKELDEALKRLDERVDLGSDVYTLVESRLFEARLQSLLVPSSPPVAGTVGSGFGFRLDPITGRAALHTGLDFPAEVGTPIHAAAGGMVVVSNNHPAYGQLLEIDHGNSLITRYAHASKLLVRNGELVKRGQKIAEVGSSGRSTGPHLHFEVLVAGVPQNPTRFLAGKGKDVVPMLMADASAGTAAARGRASAQAAGADAAAPAPKSRRERRAMAAAQAAADSAPTPSPAAAAAAPEPQPAAAATPSATAAAAADDAP